MQMVHKSVTIIHGGVPNHFGYIKSKSGGIQATLHGSVGIGSTAGMNFRVI